MSDAQTFAASMHSSMMRCASLRLHRHDALDFAVRVEDHLGLDRLEIDRAALGARLGEHVIEPVEIRQVRHQRAVLGGRRTLRVLENVGDHAYR